MLREIEVLDHKWSLNIYKSDKPDACVFDILHNGIGVFWLFQCDVALDIVNDILESINELPISTQLQQERNEAIKDVRKFLAQGLRKRGFDVGDEISLTNVLSIIDTLQGD